MYCGSKDHAQSLSIHSTCQRAFGTDHINECVVFIGRFDLGNGEQDGRHAVRRREEDHRWRERRRRSSAISSSAKRDWRRRISPAGPMWNFSFLVSGYDKIEALVDETVSAEVNKKLPDALKEALKGVEGDEAIAATTEQVTAAVTADAKAGVMQLVFTSVGGGSVTCDFFDQIKGDGVTDVRIIKADEKRVAQDDNFNWGKVTGWNLQFGEKVAKIAAGDAFDAEIGVKNLRTAFFRPVPNVPSSALDVLEFEPFFRSLGKGDPSATGAWSFDIFMNVNLEAADFSQAEFIEFDFYVSDYDKTMALFEGKENVGLRLSLGSEPGQPVWSPGGLRFPESAEEDRCRLEPRQSPGWGSLPPRGI